MLRCRIGEGKGIYAQEDLSWTTSSTSSFCLCIDQIRGMYPSALIRLSYTAACNGVLVPVLRTKASGIDKY